jgi:L-threonylcarbamoyladenylate synthase
VSPTTAGHVADDLGELVDYVLDGGPCPVGVESTIVDCTVDPPQILRPGGIGSEEIAAMLGGDLAAADGPSRAPGMLASHYAPSARVVLTDGPAEARAAAQGIPGAWVLDRSDDLVEYARSLYAELRAADERGVEVIVAVLPPAQGLGHAIRDRLMKAAAAR